MSEEKQKTPKTISRREFLKDAGIVVGGTAVGSAFFLSACGKEVEVTKTVTTTAPGATSTITKTAPGTTSTVTTTAGGTTQTVTKYTCPVCNQEFTSLDALKTHFDEVHEDEFGEKSLISLNINHEIYNVFVQANWTLQYILNVKLGLVGAKDWCEQGACGSCTVIVDGRPVLSCMMLACECEDKDIETIEGIANAEHPLIKSFIKNYALQCGYCTPGFIVTAKALLDRNNNPTEDEIKNALSGNLCRCSAYPKMPKAVMEAAATLKGGE